MKIEPVFAPGSGQPQLPAPAEVVERSRQPAVLAPASEPVQAKSRPEEILDRIKALTEDGLYSVRFERSAEFDTMIIKLVESQSGELIRQIPPEELLGTAKFLREFRGNMINTES